MKIFSFNNTYSSLPTELFHNTIPEQKENPQMVLFNNSLAAELNINTESINKNMLTNILCGNTLPEQSTPIAQAYSGHQFGQYTVLGDGRAILLGEHITQKNKRVDIQLKGSGITPYSRRGDGKATLSSMIREYIYSEAIHFLNIPTTRSLSVVSASTPAYREQPHKSAVLCRIADSHIRVGTFQYARNFCTHETLQALLNYTIKRHFPEIINHEIAALSLLKLVMDKQIDLIVNWMRVGFIHGVMNTDNMLVSGETIDYGPCAFMNTYNPSTVFSSIDEYGRYAYENQPGIAIWNITRFAESLLPLINSNNNIAIEKAKEILNSYESIFKNKFLTMMFHKIGITSPEKEDNQLLGKLTSLIEKHKADFTNTFVQLMYPEIELNECFKQQEFKVWITNWKKRVGDNPCVLKTMKLNNPVFIARTHLVENAITELSQNNNNEPFNTLMSALEKPYTLNMNYHNIMNPPNEAFDNSYKTYCGT